MSTALFDQLSERACYERLDGNRVGRLAVVDGGYPLVFPVNYVLDGETVVVRVAEGTKLWAARGERVSLQIDRYDPIQREGWSVLLIGVATEVFPDRDPRYAHYPSLPLRPWVPGDRSHWLRITPARVSGRILLQS